ncbi:hypothetical protein EN805_06125 [bacterium M00.F.Ca.ET.162.01.1.1]|nr:hypothetical protein EN848_01705 [bacterium M00.F.Ca.ET.205.01.1.1]TGU54568.1 hypothetical protein EN795_06120 [bacterium M00.F.Ca.ET.152.01.1.1]TGZ44140.1 hypothetical protein EN805_06125 [bacterium M00.F.Ca.ET.162.01.1.1]
MLDRNLAAIDLDTFVRGNVAMLVLAAIVAAMAGAAVRTPRRSRTKMPNMPAGIRCHENVISRL